MPSAPGRSACRTWPRTAPTPGSPAELRETGPVSSRPLAHYYHSMYSRLCLAALIAASAAAQTTTEIDNAWVRVLRVKQAPREKSPAQQHPDAVSVYLTDTRQRVNGTESSHKARDVAWLKAGNYAEENLSDQPLEYVLMELKPGAPKAKGWPVALDPVKLDPVHHLVPIEND